MNTQTKLITLVLISLIWSFFSQAFDFKGMLFIFPFIHGLLFGLFYHNRSSYNWLYILLTAISFFIVFIVSSVMGLWLSKLLAGTDNLTPFISTPFSIIAIVFILKTGLSVRSLLPTVLLAIFAGIVATFLTSSEWQVEKDSLLTMTLFDTAFLWQTSTGTILIIGIDRLKNIPAPLS